MSMQVLGKLNLTFLTIAKLKTFEKKSQWHGQDSSYTVLSQQIVMLRMFCWIIVHFIQYSGENF